MKLIVEDFVFPITLTDDDKGMSEQEFLEFCQRNPELQLERDAEGNIIIMSPVHIRSANFEVLLSSAVNVWVLNGGGGMAFSSQAGFTLPNGAVRSPDASWLSKEQVRDLLEEEMEQFAHICPVFVGEIRSKTDRIQPLHAKMKEYMANGARLGFLIDPMKGQAWVYHPDKEPEFHTELNGFLSGGDIMPGFELDLSLFNKQ